MFRVSGVENVGGDMFESVPRGDAIFMKVKMPADLMVILKSFFRRSEKFLFHFSLKPFKGKQSDSS